MCKGNSDELNHGICEERGYIEPNPLPLRLTVGMTLAWYRNGPVVDAHC